MKRYLAGLLAGLLLLAGCAPAGGEVDLTLRREKMTQAEAEAVPAARDTVTLRTDMGRIKGIRREGWLEFRGIRYATAERWEQAVPATGWEGVYDATQWGDRSLQHLGFYGQVNSVSSQFYADEALVQFPAQYSEDSLNLNIWMPEEGENFPVLVYIHGGAFITGSGSDTPIDGEAYAKRGIVVVSVNYRLGPFASVYGEGWQGNLALTDQITALHWIRDNIGNFGGDPARITLMGESAGAISVQDLLISPAVEDGLVAGAIMLSGGGDVTAMGSPTLPMVASTVWNVVKAAGGFRSLEELRQLPARELYELWNNNLGLWEDLAPQPVQDGTVLTGTVAGALAAGTVKDVPVIMGILSHDLLPHTLYTAAVEYAQARAAAGGKPVYLYYFDRIQPGDETFGAFHGADLYYVFGTLYRNRRPFEDVDYRIAENMIDYIANFVKTGDPNGAELPVWSAAAEEPLFLNFGVEEPAMMHPDEEQLLRQQQTGPMFPFAESIRPAE